jgi:hypothetical protein
MEDNPWCSKSLAPAPVNMRCYISRSARVHIHESCVAHEDEDDVVSREDAGDLEQYSIGEGEEDERRRPVVDGPQRDVEPTPKQDEYTWDDIQRGRAGTRHSHDPRHNQAHQQYVCRGPSLRILHFLPFHQSDVYIQVGPYHYHPGAEQKTPMENPPAVMQGWLEALPRRLISVPPSLPADSLIIQENGPERTLVEAPHSCRQDCQGDHLPLHVRPPRLLG